MTKRDKKLVPLTISKPPKAVTEQQNKLPDSIFIVAGDFNHSNLKSLLIKFHNIVGIETRKGKPLGQVYTNLVY